MSLSLPVPPKPWLNSDSFITPKTLLVTKTPIMKVSTFKDKNGKEKNQYVYFFQDKEGNSYEFSTTSGLFVEAFNNAQLDIGDNVLIARAGTQQKPVWTVSKVQKDF